MWLRSVLFLVMVAACGSGSEPDEPMLTPDAMDPGPMGCARMAAPADRARFAVVSHPYDLNGKKAGAYEVLDLATDGTPSRSGRTFTMGRATTGTISFTPDGEVGLLALEDGKIGVFRLDATGTPTIVHEAFEGSFYASHVIVEPRGDLALVLDGNWRENGGGIYRVAIGCDGTLTEVGMVAAAKLPGALAFTGDHAVLAAADIMDANTPGYDVHLLGWGTAPTVLAGADAFGDDMAIVSGAALTADGATFLLGDSSQFSNVPNRVAAVRVTASAVQAGGTIPVEDPAAIATSPFGNVAVVASGFGDALYVLDDTGGTWHLRGELAYTGAAPQLPTDLATIDRGALRGHVLVSENVSVRHLAFRDTGAVEDLGSLAFGSGLQNISGAIGVTP